MDKNEKALEDLIQKAIKNIELEKPSMDFTTNVMASVKTVAQSEVTKYRSPISKTAWAVIFGIMGVLCVYLFLNMEGEETSWLSGIDYSFITDSKLVSGLSHISIPGSVVYGIVALAVMTILQVPIYKRYYDKRLGL